MSHTQTHSRHAKSRFQRGVAAVEFALIAVFMITLLLGLLVFWRYFQAHQSLTRAAGDGARAAHSVIASGINPCDPSQDVKNKALIEKRIQQTISSSLKQSSIPGDVESNLTLNILEWGDCPPGGNSSISFTVTYTMDALLGESNSWFTELRQLQETSSLHFASML